MRRVIILLLAAGQAWAEPTSNEQSSQDSSEQSTQESLEESTNQTTEGNSKDTNALLTTVGLVLVTGIAVGAASIKGRDRARAEQRLAAYLKANDRALTRDLLRTEGPLLDGWLDELGLEADEATRFKRRLEGSEAQATLLAALKDPTAQARGFAVAFRTALAETVGAPRMAEIDAHLLGG